MVESEEERFKEELSKNVPIGLALNFFGPISTQDNRIQSAQTYSIAFFSHLFSHLSHFSQQVNSLSGSKQKKYR